MDANVARQNELLVIINKNTAAYRQAFGFREWRQACEVSRLHDSLLLWLQVSMVNARAIGNDNLCVTAESSFCCSAALLRHVARDRLIGTQLIPHV